MSYRQSLVTSLFAKLKAKNLRLVTAESCTGGMIASAITNVSGASEVFDRGFVTYSNEAKNEMIGVPMELIKKHGAVSAEVAESMARGALNYAKAQVAIAVTGIAGPAGGTATKPVGLIYIAVANGDRVRVTKNYITGNRLNVRRETVSRALELALNFVD